MKIDFQKTKLSKNARLRLYDLTENSSLFENQNFSKQRNFKIVPSHSQRDFRYLNQRLTKILMQCSQLVAAAICASVPVATLTLIDKNLFVAEVNDPSNLTRSRMPPRHSPGFFSLLGGLVNISFSQIKFQFKSCW